MKMLMDSSALAKRYVLEKGSEKANVLLQEASELALSILVIPEIISALNRRVREKTIEPNEYQGIKMQFLKDADDTTLLQLTTQVIKKSVRLLENNKLRALDSMHIACALKWEAELFVTADKKQFKAAQNEGLQVKFIG